MVDPDARRHSAQWKILAAGGGLAVGLLAIILSDSVTRAMLFAIGLAMGIALYHASFGFSGAYRKRLVEREMTGVAAQIVMLAAAILLFTPILNEGRAFGQAVTGSVAPVSLALAFGAFIFGIGMQLGSGCASGVLYTAGGGNGRTLLVLVFFCAGSFWASLDMGWWRALPGIGAVSLIRTLGWEAAVPLQIGALALIFLGLRRGGWTMRPISAWPGGLTATAVLRGPWPLLVSALLLALLNWATLLVAGHAWSITWGFTLWGGKIAALLGWNPAGSDFWAGNFQQAALAGSVLTDTTSLMNIAILLGALLAAGLGGTFYKRQPFAAGPLLAAVVAGLLMGYGARLSYGCNIGAFFSGVASSSLHGWVWILFALPGNALGIVMRRPFRLDAQAAPLST